MKELIKNMLERGAFSQDFIVGAIEVALAGARKEVSVTVEEPKTKRAYKKSDAEGESASHDEIRAIANELKLRKKAERLTADEVIALENIVGRRS